MAALDADALDCLFLELVSVQDEPAFRAVLEGVPPPT